MLPSASSPRLRLSAAILASAAFLLAMGAAKMADTGTISGKVVDSADKPAASVRVQFEFFGKSKGASGPKAKSADGIAPDALAQTATGNAATTDAAGSYSITLAPGRYMVTAGSARTTGTATDAVRVEAGKTATLNLKLDPPDTGE